MGDSHRRRALVAASLVAAGLVASSLSGALGASHAAAAPRPPAAAQARASLSGYVLLSGRVVTSSGKAAVNVPVFVEHHVGFLDAVTAVFSLGLVCLAPGDRICGGSVAEARTDSHGDWSARVAPGGVLATEKSDVVIGDRTDDTSAKTTTSFAVDPDGLNLRLPAETLYTPAIHVQKLAAGTAAVSWSPLPRSAGSSPSYDLALVGKKGATDFYVENASDGGPLPAYSLEAGEARASVIGHADVRGLGGVTYRTGGVSLGPLRYPLSRGKACATYGVHDAVRGIDHCPWTDGKLADPDDEIGTRGGFAGHAGCAGCTGLNDAIRVDLGAVEPVVAVTLRGCTFSCSVQTSVNGRTWTDFGADGDDTSDADDYATVLPSNPSAVVTARYVRVEYSFEPDLHTSREISV